MRVKRKRIPGKIASVNVNERELALDIRELLLIPLKKNTTTS